MPQMGVSVAEGTIVSWRKQPGDWVEADETVCDITTDKIDTEIPSPASGRLVEILVEENRTVTVGTPLARIDTGAHPGQPHADETTVRAAVEASPIAPTSSPRSCEGSQPNTTSTSQVTGTGVGGRIRKKDVLAFIEAGRPEGATAPYRVAIPAGARACERRTANCNGERAPLSPMRRQIAEHMLRSRRTAAHVTTFAEVDMSHVVARRAALKEQFAARGVPLTYLAFVARATVSALQEQPVLNASIDGEDLVYHDDVNLGIAVALEDGLIVPVIREGAAAQPRGHRRGGRRSVQRGRGRSELAPEDVQGGTFTITNPGQFGTILATPIINQPQVAILDLEAVVKRAVVVEVPEGDSIAIRPMVNLCLSFDHRALDGAAAARFLGAVKTRLEQWADDA